MHQVNHIVKYRYVNGAITTNPLSWCGKEIGGEWSFTDANHYILSKDKGMLAAEYACKNCVKKILEVLSPHD